MKKKPTPNQQSVIGKRLAWEMQVAEMRDGRRQRAATFVNRKREADRAEHYRQGADRAAAIWAAGLSPARLIVMLLPLAFLAGGINFVLSDSAIPATTPQLRDWGVGDYGAEKLKLGEKDPIWMRAGNDILRAGSANADSTELNDDPRFTTQNPGSIKFVLQTRE